MKTPFQPSPRTTTHPGSHRRRRTELVPLGPRPLRHWPMTSITIAAVLVADLLAEGERMPVYVHVIEHPEARVLVDTGMTQLHPAVADLDPRLYPLSTQDSTLHAS